MWCRKSRRARPCPPRARQRREVVVKTQDWMSTEAPSGGSSAARKARLAAATLLCALASGGWLAGNAFAWSPEPAKYGVAEQRNLPVTMSDGTVLRVNVYYPALGGQAAKGRFPVLLTQTPYGKDALGAAGGATGEDSYLVQRGYIDVVADVRGTGDS